MVKRTTGMLDDVFAGLTPTETRDLLDLLRHWLADLAALDRQSQRGHLGRDVGDRRATTGVVHPA